MATTIFLVNPTTFPVSTSYLLDTYSAAAAYSLRQLKTGVTSVVRVRRSSDNAESDFTADEITDGTLTTWTGASDGFVTVWYDQAGSNNMTQSTAGSQAKIVSSGSVLTLNGLPTVTFDGTDDYLQTPSAVSWFNSVPFTTSAVINSTASGSVAPMMSARNDGTTDPNDYGFIMYADRSANNIHSILKDSATTNTYNYLATDNTSSQRLQTLTVDSSANGNAYLNSTLQESISMGTFSFTLLRKAYIGRQKPGAAIYAQGNVQEWIVWATDESANRTDIESDINTHYSIY